jgi:hypothetical protein
LLKDRRRGGRFLGHPEGVSFNFFLLICAESSEQLDS